MCVCVCMCGKEEGKNVRGSVLLMIVITTTTILYYNIKSRLKRDRTTRATFFFRQSPSKRITDLTIKYINYYNIIGTYTSSDAHYVVCVCVCVFSGVPRHLHNVCGLSLYTHMPTRILQ